MPAGIDSGEALAVYAYDRDHVLVGGSVGREPAIWTDNQLQVLQRSYPMLHDDYERPFGSVNAIVRADGHVYAAGAEYYNEENQVATVWCDGVPTHLNGTGENFIESEVVDIQAYGKDVYVLTAEYSTVSNGEYSYPALASVLWMNGNEVGRIWYKGMVSFAVY